MVSRYEDFVLVVEGSRGSYTVEAEGPGGIRIPPVASPYQEREELRAELGQIQRGLAPSRERMQEVGTMLFDALFPRAVIRAFERAPDALPPDTGLRLKLVVRPPELGPLPWELLYDPDQGIFLAARLSYPIVRFVESGTPAASLLARRPLRVLQVQASPEGATGLDMTASEEALREALGAAGEVETIQAVTPAALRDALRQRPGYHVLHYDGHAAFDAAKGEGFLFLHDGDGGSYPLGGEMLANDLDGTPVRLVVLAACEAALDSAEKRFSGVAGQLMRAGSLPAVVAMQFDIPDRSAIAFTREFYRALARGYPVDAAMVDGRKGVLEGLGGDAGAFASPDWAAPVLFMRVADGDVLRYEEPHKDSGQEARTPFHAPPLPDQYVERPAELQKLKDQWLPTKEGASPPVSQALLHGVAAVGKSTLAAAFAHDEEVRKWFPDGVLWVTLGNKPDVPQRLGDWGQALGDPAVSEGGYRDAQAGSSQLRTFLQDKACLLVVDDAWKREHVDPFKVGGAHCLLLVTSRIEAVLPGANTIELDEMREEEALALMANWAGAIGKGDRPTAAWLAQELGYLPLALELAGAQAKELGGWPAFRDLWEKEKLAAIERGWAPESPQDSLLLSLELSWQALQKDTREPYLQLGVFGGDTLFPTGAAAALWGRSEPLANKLLSYLTSQALLTRREIDGVRWYTFHDVLYEFVLERLGERGRTQAHAALVDGYRARCGGQWATLKDDGYVHGHLASHMAGAGLYDDMCALVLDGAWRASQQEAHRDSRATLSDLQRALDLALARDDLVMALDCVATHRETSHATSIIRAIYQALELGDLKKALILAPVKGTVEDWGRALYLYLAWEAALAGEAARSREAVAEAGRLRLVQAGDLCDALLMRIALVLAGGDPAQAQKELAALGRGGDGAWLAQRYAPGRPLPDDEAQKILAQLKEKMKFLVRELRTAAVKDERDAWTDRFSGDELAVEWADAAGPDSETEAAYAREIREQLGGVAASLGGPEFVQQLLAVVEMNLYPRYRDVGLIECGIACLRVAGDGWVREMLQRIIRSGLSREGVVFTFDLPYQLLAAARRQGLSESKLGSLPGYKQKALSHRDRWGTQLRALSAHAAALHRDGQVDQAVQALLQAGSEPIGYAGYGVLHMLALANRWREFGDLATGSKLLDRAAEQAYRVRNDRFRQDRVALVGQFRDWWMEARMDTKTALAALAEIRDTDTRLTFLEHLSARWASAAEGPNWEGLKKLLSEVLVHGTGSFRDAILGRLFGVWLDEHKLADDDLAGAIAICERQVMLSKPWAVGN